MSEKDRNGILLLFLSDFKDKSESGSDYTINGRSYFGRQTNEAPTKFLLDTAHTDDYPIKKVLCITSKLVIGTKNNYGKTSYEVFSERLRKYRSSKGYDGEVDIIPIDYEKSEEKKENDGFSDIALPVYTELNENLRSNIKKNMYLDEDVSIPNIIRWCLDNSLIQQAITLYVEKMPSYYFSQGIIKRSEDDTEDDTGLFYGKVYDDLLRDPGRESFFEMIKDINDSLDDELKPDWNIINDKYRYLSEQIKRVKEIYTHRYVSKRSRNGQGKDKGDIVKRN